MGGLVRASSTYLSVVFAVYESVQWCFKPCWVTWLALPLLCPPSCSARVCASDARILAGKNLHAQSVFCCARVLKIWYTEFHVSAHQQPVFVVCYSVISTSFNDSMLSDSSLIPLFFPSFATSSRLLALLSSWLQGSCAACSPSPCGL